MDGLFVEYMVKNEFKILKEALAVEPWEKGE
jgi:hypothetical protein